MYNYAKTMIYRCLWSTSRSMGLENTNPSDPESPAEHDPPSMRCSQVTPWDNHGKSLGNSMETMEHHGKTLQGGAPPSDVNVGL